MDDDRRHPATRAGAPLTALANNVPTVTHRMTLWSARLPALLLALALSTVFVFGNDRGQFYRPGNHDTVTANNMTQVGNLSADHNFARFYYRTLREDGTPTYLPYHRFPPGGYWLLKLATLPFGDGLSERLHAARLAMLCFFAAAAFLTYLSATRLVANRWIATAATGLAFAGYYPLYYNDMVAPETIISLCGVLLVFHGMVIFEQERRFAQLLIKVCGALLLTWHVYALLLAFIALRVGTALTAILRGAVAPAPSGRHPNRVAQCLALVRSRHVALGVASLIFGATVLAVGLAQEHALMNGELALTELPTVRSALYRVGVRPEVVDAQASFGWLPFLNQQALRVTAMCVPYALYGYYADTLREIASAPLVALGVASGVAVAGALLIAIRFSRAVRAGSGTLLATVALYGFFWALPMRHYVFFHDSESLHYVGIPLVLALLALGEVHRRLGERCIIGLAVGALVVFGLSSARMSRIGHDSQAASRQEALFADFDAIRNHVPTGEAVAVPIRRAWQADIGFAGVARASAYFLAGRTIVFDGDPCGFADYVIASGRRDGNEDGRRTWHRQQLLTPDNRLRFLYRGRASKAAAPTGHCADDLSSLTGSPTN